MIKENRMLVIPRLEKKETKLKQQQWKHADGYFFNCENDQPYGDTHVKGMLSNKWDV